MKGIESKTLGIRVLLFYLCLVVCPLRQIPCVCIATCKNMNCKMIAVAHVCLGLLCTQDSMHTRYVSPTIVQGRSQQTQDVELMLF